MTQIWQSKYWPSFDYDRRQVEGPLAHAQEAMGEILGLQIGLGAAEQEQIRFAQITAEALASFGIEGVTLNAAEIEASVVASLKHRDKAPPSRRSDAIAELMIEARNGALPLDEARLLSWHRLLFFGIEVEDPGRWRRFEIEIVRSAAAGSSDVLYKAPPPERVGAEMDRFLAWLAAPPELPLPVVAGIAHLWFESIHPFSDGNGRIGRAIIEHVFARHRALPFSLSRQIEREKKAYYAALQEARREGQGVIDATPFLVWFLDCLSRAAEAGRQEALFLIRRNAFFMQFASLLSERQEKAFRLLFAQGAPRIAEGLTARSWRKLTGVSPATATRDLLALQQAGILRSVEAGGRSSAYEICA